MPSVKRYPSGVNVSPSIGLFLLTLTCTGEKTLVRVFRLWTAKVDDLSEEYFRHFVGNILLDFADGATAKIRPRPFLLKDN